MSSLAPESHTDTSVASVEHHLDQREGAEVIHLPAATAEQVEETRGDLYDWETDRLICDVDFATD